MKTYNSHTLEYCRSFVKDKDIKCLNMSYENVKTRMEWKCKRCERIWFTSFASILNGSGCPYCNMGYSRGEELCRNIFEYIFDDVFPKKRPKWLINPKTNRKMELDGYNEKLKIAFEYNGECHYKILSHIKKKGLEGIQYRDKLKVKLCKNKGIKLIILKYFDFKKSDRAIFNNLLTIVKENNIKITEQTILDNQLEEIFNVSLIHRIKLAQERAEKVNMIFLGLKRNDGKYRLEWRGNNVKYWYQCKKCKRLWEKIGSAGQQGHGCWDCEHLRKPYLYTYEEAIKVIKILNIRTEREYKKRYKENPLLPSNPQEYYKNKGWINWIEFLPNKKYEYLEAEQVVQTLQIQSVKDYEKHAINLDSKLPTRPNKKYKNKGWINWYVFLGIHYETYEEAKTAVKKLSIKTEREYKKRYKEDPKLPSNPNITYKNKGWTDLYDFLTIKKPIIYNNYIDAKNVTVHLKIFSCIEYKKRYKEDPKLPSNPNSTYKNKGWISWPSFLNRRNPQIYYKDYDKAKKAIYKLNIKTREEYWKRYKEDLKLPSRPYIVYKNKGWINWFSFLEKRNPEMYYKTYEKAHVGVKRLNIKTLKEYLCKYKQDQKLPSDPQRAYKNKGWTTWYAFLGKATRKNKA